MTEDGKEITQRLTQRGICPSLWIEICQGKGLEDLCCWSRREDAHEKKFRCSSARDEADALVVAVECLDEDFCNGSNEEVGLWFYVFRRSIRVNSRRSKKLGVRDDGVGKDLDDYLFQRIVAFCEAVEEEFEVF